MLSSWQSSSRSRVWCATTRTRPARLGVDPSHCVGVEDSSNGLRAAHAAGLTVVALPNPTYPPKSDALALATTVADGVAGARAAVLALLEGRDLPRHAAATAPGAPR